MLLCINFRLFQGEISGAATPSPWSLLTGGLYLLPYVREHGLFVSAIKGYKAALNDVFSLTGLDLATCLMVSQMFHHFERS